jgi:glycosyltransferase involved in cell wall biosynthesis
VCLTRLFPALVDGFAVLSDNAIPLAEREYPRLKRKPRVVTRQGPFDAIYPSEITKQAARRILGLADDEVVGLAFGQVRPYKAIPALLDVFRAVDRPDVRLVVAGKPRPPTLGDEIEDRARLDPRVLTRLDYVPTADVQAYFAAADLVILNHTELLNSGAALLALRFERPLLAPALGSLPELAARAGPWVTLFDVLDPQVLDAALQEATRPRAPLHLDGQTWDAHAEAVVGLYRSLR